MLIVALRLRNIPPYYPRPHWSSDDDDDDDDDEPSKNVIGIRSHAQRDLDTTRNSQDFLLVLPIQS